MDTNDSSNMLIDLTTETMSSNTQINTQISTQINTQPNFSNLDVLLPKLQELSFKFDTIPFDMDESKAVTWFLSVLIWVKTLPSAFVNATATTNVLW
jgi:hypothetical protein